MTEPRQDPQAENAGAYVLGALSELETRAFERHLADCPSCRDEVERLRVGVDALSRSVEQVSPPPALRQALMREVEADAASDPAAATAAGPSTRRRFDRGLARLRPLLAPAAAAAVAVTVLAAGYGLGRVTDDEAAPGSQPTRTVPAKVNREGLSDANASLLVPRGADRTPLLRVQGLRPLKDRVYQVWIRRGGEIVPDGVFAVDSDGTGVAAVSQDLSEADAVLVTRERPGGAKAPSEVPLLSVPL